ncbi:Ada metal-binding domain-containing protein [Chengkuizengella axinellae]|uniref:DNA-3-methyladenine glycosylase II n=1 Tax=Chengkuizengella axinellae TaxID=3064388 RepID=A0ABT9J1T0_9BACL|nr:Ada metal-binding domain-containing protein [Chengkuizengella sp. 2205SS18-9]MDP5275523.1 Ada metal-binding domain-containing protein [Chengkuizengella sp. 2205SS18-9]
MDYILSNNDMYNIMKSRDSSYDGKFFICKKTNETYCLASCESVQSPTIEEIIFTQTFIEAEANGYKPCKLCHPNVHEVKWKDRVDVLDIEVPNEFDFIECLVILNRSDEECLHKVVQNELYKLLKFNKKFVLFKISFQNHLTVTFLNGIPTQWMRAQIARYIWDMFDLGTDITPFYSSFKSDHIMGKLTEKFYGLRLIKINNLFEALCWSILGQQINLRFAYTLKKRFVHQFAENFTYKDTQYWVFPTADQIADVKVEELKEMQISTRKAEYIVGVAKLISNGILDQKKLRYEENYQRIVEQLTSIRGIGKWTADYTIMKCFSINSAFPIADVGIHNALKTILKLNEKPSIKELEKLVKQWEGWESYAAFYLWRSLYDEID